MTQWDALWSTSDRAAPARSRSRYTPHQNLREQARRLKQVGDGALKGPMVTEGAVYTAHGLVHPTDPLRPR